MIVRSILIICSLLIMPFLSFAQTEATAPPDRENFVRLTTQYGTILRRNGPFFESVDAEGDEFKNIQAINLEYGWQMLPGKDWAKICRYPRFGFGVQYLRFLNRNELGHPFSIYGFYNGNFLQRKRFLWTSQLSAGLGFGLTTYDPTDDLPNDIISSKVNAFIELSSNLAFKVGNRLWLEPGIKFSHFSNGNTKKPQKGINIFSYALGVRYQLKEAENAFAEKEVEPCQHRHEVLAYIGYGTRQLDYNDKDNDKPTETYGLTFSMANLHLGYNYELFHRMKIGGGVDVIYDGSNGMWELGQTRKPSKSDIAFTDKTGLMAFAGLESIAGKLAIAVNFGYMVVKTEFPRSTPRFEQRLGFKYHFYKNVFAGVNIRAYNFHVAKAVEYHIGVRQYLKS